MNATAQRFFHSYLSMSGDIKKAVQVHPLNLYNYRHEEIWATVYQIVDPNKPQRDIDGAHCQALAVFVRNYNYGYASGMIAVHFFL